MKVNIKVLSDNKSVTFDINEAELIETLNDLLNSHLNITDDFYFIYNKVICETGKSLSELELIDDCVIFAAKKSDKPLKRKLENDDLSNLLSFGATSKKFCTFKEDDSIEYSLWQSKSLSDIQKDLSKIVYENPFVLEPLLLQGPIEQMIHNPSILQSLYTVNPIIGDLMEKKPDKVKFFSDLSQYNWIKNVVTDSAEMERLMIHYCENFKNITESKRYRRMAGILEKADIEGEGEEYLQRGLAVLKKAGYTEKVCGGLIGDSEVSEQVLRACPYGAEMSEEDLGLVQGVLPGFVGVLRAAMGEQGGSEAMLRYLCTHPVEVEDEATAARLAEVSGRVGGARPVGAGTATALWPRVATMPDSACVPGDGLDLVAGVELLAEMGFPEPGAVLAREYGSANRAAIALATPR